VEAIFVALGDRSRRSIFIALMDGDKPIKDLAEPIGITLTGLGQHIKILETASLVRTQKVGRRRICSIDPRGMEALGELAKWHKSLWKSRFESLRTIVEAE